MAKSAKKGGGPTKAKPAKTARLVRLPTKITPAPDGAPGTLAASTPLGGIDATVLDRLAETVEARRGTDPERSHSARLLARGTAKIAQKLGEEAVETVIEATRRNRAATIAESADLLYHLIVLWADAGIAPHEVWAELQRREGTSGIDEKAARKVPPVPLRARPISRTRKIW